MSFNETKKIGDPLEFLIRDIRFPIPEEPFSEELPPKVKTSLWNYALEIATPEEEEQVGRWLAVSPRIQQELLRIRRAMEDAGRRCSMGEEAEPMPSVLRVVWEKVHQWLAELPGLFSSLGAVVIDTAKGLWWSQQGPGMEWDLSQTCQVVVPAPVMMDVAKPPEFPPLIELRSRQGLSVFVNRIGHGKLDLKVSVSEERSQEDVHLAAVGRLAECGERGKKFQDLIAAHLKEQVRWYDPLPRLKERWSSVFLPEPRCWQGVLLNVADLSGELSQALKSLWRLPNLNPLWEPPHSWQSLYGLKQNQVQPHGLPANQLRVHLVRGVFGKRVLVAVATVSPVEFQSGRGPVLVPTGNAHVACIEQVVRRWWHEKRPGRASEPDMYLVVLSTTGWEGQAGRAGCLEEYALPGPWRLTVAAEPQGANDFRVAFPPLVGQPTRIRNFLALLSPQTHSQRLTDICQWLEKTLEVRSFLSMADAQEELEELWPRSIHPQWILDAFAHLAGTGKYRITWKENPQLRKASALEQVQSVIARRWW